MEQIFSCKKIVTTIGVSEVITTDTHKTVTSKPMEWIFKIPKDTKITAKITKNGGTINFVVPVSDD